MSTFCRNLPYVPWSLLCLFRMGAACAEVDAIDAHARYPEGPMWDHGRLLYVEYAGDDIKSWDGKQSTVYWRKDHCGASALIHFRGDHILVACYDGNYLAELEADGKEVRTISNDSSGKPFAGPNDFATDGHGGVYFSASGVYDIKAPITGAVLHLSADGQDLRVVADLIHYSNGLTLAKDGQHLLVAEMLAGRILSFPIQANGTLGPRVVWARLQDLAPPTPHEDAYNGPDGLKLGPDGNYYIAQNGSGRLLVVDEEKKLLRLIDVPTPYVTNVAFGPTGADTLYITGAFDQWKPPFPGAVYRWTP
jgi:gluconolactonase